MSKTASKGTKRAKAKPRKHRCLWADIERSLRAIERPKKRKRKR